MGHCWADETELPATDELIDRVAASVRERTGGHVRVARVTVGGRVVTVSGIAPSFYLKQLALEAARVALGGLPFQLALDVTVHAR